MRAEIAGKDQDGAGVKVTDDEGGVHQVVVLPDGSVDEHSGPEHLSPEEDESLLEAVENLAIYTVHWQTDFEVVDPPWDPNVIRRGIDAIESLPDDRFKELFEETYRELQSPSTDAPIDHVEMIMQEIYLADDGAIETVSDIMVGVTPPGGQFGLANPEAHDPDDYSEQADVSIGLPPYEFDFPFGDRFREFLVHHLKCQIRDIYHTMGESPPTDCQVNGIGKMQAGE